MSPWKSNRRVAANTATVGLLPINFFLFLSSLDALKTWITTWPWALRRAQTNYTSISSVISFRCSVGFSAGEQTRSGLRSAELLFVITATTFMSLSLLIWLALEIILLVNIRHPYFHALVVPANKRIYSHNFGIHCVLYPGRLYCTLFKSAWRITWQRQKAADNIITIIIKLSNIEVPYVPTCNFARCDDHVDISARNCSALLELQARNTPSLSK